MLFIWLVVLERVLGHRIALFIHTHHPRAPYKHNIAIGIIIISPSNYDNAISAIESQTLDPASAKIEWVRWFLLRQRFQGPTYGRTLHCKPLLHAICRLNGRLWNTKIRFIKLHQQQLESSVNNLVLRCDATLYFIKIVYGILGGFWHRKCVGMPNHARQIIFRHITYAMTGFSNKHIEYGQWIR